MQRVGVLFVNKDFQLRRQPLSRMALEHSFGIADDLFLKSRSFQHFSMSAVSKSRRARDGAAPAVDISIFLLFDRFEFDAKTGVSLFASRKWRKCTLLEALLAYRFTVFEVTNRALQLPLH